jgi:hypothetical protein
LLACDGAALPTERGALDPETQQRVAALLLHCLEQWEKTAPQEVRFFTQCIRGTYTEWVRPGAPQIPHAIAHEPPAPPQPGVSYRSEPPRKGRRR